MALFRRVKPPFGLKTLVKDSNCVLVQDPSAIWGAADFLPRRNLLTYSEQFNVSPWSLTKMSAFGSGSVADSTTAPDGTVTADLIVEDSSLASGRYVICTVSSGISIGDKLNLSAYFKKHLRRYVYLHFYDTTSRGAILDLDTGTVTATYGSATSLGVESLGSQWYRLTVQMTASSTSFYVVSGTTLVSGSVDSHDGDGASGFYMWGAQLSKASTLNQSYQKITNWTTEQYAWAAQKNVPWLRRNRFLSTATLATQTVSSVTATPLTVSFTGTGTITFSTAYSGSLVGTGAGDRVTATFTPSAGNLVCTVSGSVTLAQCEVGSTATPYQEVGASWAATYTALATAAGYPISLYSDRAGTTAVTGPDETVGKLLDLSGDNNHATAPSDAARPVLRLDGNGKWYLERDLSDDNLAVTWPTSLTTTGVVYIAAGDYTTKDSGLILSGATDYKTPKYDYGRIVLLKESTNDAKIIKYLDGKRGRSYSLGPELVTNGGFDSDTTGWEETAVSIMSWEAGRVKLTAGAAGNGARQQLALTIGKKYLVVGTVNPVSCTNMLVSILRNDLGARLFDSQTVTAGSSTVSFTFVATETNSHVYIRPGAAGIGYGDNISVREILL